jgi:hypothetical protein
MSKRLTYEFVKTEFEKEDYILLSKEYKNNHTKLDYMCPNGHEHSITWNKWQTGKRCPYCAGNAKLTIEFVRKSFESEGYILLSNSYVGNKTKLRYICPIGHKGAITWDNWKQGRRCTKCANNVKLTIDFVRESFEKEGYVLLTG